MNFWPRVKIKFPSDVRGQIYIPSINLMLWLGCVAIMLTFRKSSELEHIYGFFITLTMGMTTILMGIWLRYVRHWPWLLVVAILAVFATMEISFLIANSIKVIHRLSFVLVVLGLFNLMLMWYKARKITNRYLDFRNLEDHAPVITELSKDKDVPKFATHLVYLTKANSPMRAMSRRIVACSSALTT